MLPAVGREWSGIHSIQFTHYYGITPFFAIRYNPHTAEPGMVVELNTLSISKKIRIP